MFAMRIEENIHELNKELMLMASIVEDAISTASDALVHQSVQKAKQAIELSMEARQKERDVESMCLRLLLRYQPVASDLRIISAALKMITDMERISDQAGDISHIVLELSDQTYIKKLEHLPLMANVAIEMVKTSIDAYVKKDQGLAETVIQMDDEADRLFTIIKEELIELLRRNAAYGEQAISLLMVAKYFERIADHAQNIAEWAAYSVTGIHVREATNDILR